MSGLEKVDADQIVTNYHEVIDTFDALNLKEDLLRGM